MTAKEKPLYDLTVEMQVLGAFLRDNGLLDVVGSDLEAETFYDPLHARIYQTMVESRDRHALTPATLFHLLGDGVDWQGEDGIETLAAMRTIGSDGAPIRQYVAILKEFKLKRLALQDLEDATYFLRHTSRPVAKVLGPVVLVADQAAQAETRARPVLAEDIGKRVMEKMEAAARGERVPSVTTGLSLLDERIGGLQAADFMVIPARSGMGKEQPVDTPVLTPSGWTTIGTLQVGDYVVGADGRRTKVKAVWPQGIKQSFRVTFRDKTFVECGADHLWAVKSTGGRRRDHTYTRTTADLLRQGVLCKFGGHVKNKAKWKIPVAAPIEFSEVDLPIDPYILGVLIGDGAMSGGDLRFSNPDMDADIRANFASRLPSNITLSENRSGACPYFSLRGEGRKPMRAAISKLGLAVKSGAKFLPHEYLFASIKQRWDLLRGLMDTDGSCINNRTHFYTTSCQLAEGVAHLVRSLGGIAINYHYPKAHLQKPDEWHVNVKMDICPFSTARKSAHWRPTKPAKAIFAIEPVRMVQQVCITVAAEDGLYITKDFIVTHNSSMIAGICLRAAMAGHPVLLFELEMTADQLIERCIADLDYDDAARPIGYSSFRNGRLTLEQMDRAHRAKSFLNNLPFEICDAGDLTVEDIGARARAFKARCAHLTDAHGKPMLGLIGLDYLQRVQASAHKDRSREQEMAHVARALKTMAKGMAWPVAALAQLLNKGGDPRQANNEQIPTLAAIRETGQIEMEADIIVAPHRKAWFLRKQKPDAPDESPEMVKWRGDYRACKNLLRLYGLKMRHGGEFELDLWCSMASSAIRDEEPRISLTVEDRNARDLLEGLGH